MLPLAVSLRDDVRYVDERQIIPALVSAVKNARARIASLEKTLSDVLQRLMLAGL